MTCDHKKWVWTAIVMNKKERNEEMIDAKLCLKCKVVIPFCRKWSEFFKDDKN